MGSFPISEERGFGGGSIRFLHGATCTKHTLELGFVLLSQSEAALLRDHYRQQQGGYLSFTLSAEAWAGHTSQTDLVPANTAWIYSRPLEENHRKGGLVDVTVALLSVL